MIRLLKYLLVYLIITTSLIAQTGYVRSYYPNKKIKSKILFVDDILDGTSYWYYENGNLKEEKTYSDGKLHGWIIKYFPSGLVEEEISVREGVRDGLTRIYYDNGALEEVRSYEKGKLIKIVTLEYDDKYVAPMEAYRGNRQKDMEKSWDMFICQKEVCPRPVGGMDDILANLKYPEHARLYGLEGFVTVIATVDEEGKVTETRVTKGLGLGCDEAALAAVEATKFLPGGDDGQAVECEVIFNVEFKLEEKSKLAYKENMRNPELAQERLKEMLSAEFEEMNAQRGDSEGQNESPSTNSQIAEQVENYECDVEICPKPIGGLKAILDNLFFPQHIKRLGADGNVIVLVDVDEYGLVRDTKVLKGINSSINDAVEVAILNTEFIPGMKNGIEVRANVKVMVPIDQKKED